MECLVAGFWSLGFCLFTLLDGQLEPQCGGTRQRRIHGIVLICMKIYFCSCRRICPHCYWQLEALYMTLFILLVKVVRSPAFEQA
jgi:hypothetical protein